MCWLFVLFEFGVTGVLYVMCVAWVSLVCLVFHVVAVLYV